MAARLTRIRAQLGKDNVHAKFVKGSVAGKVHHNAAFHRRLPPPAGREKILGRSTCVALTSACTLLGPSGVVVRDEFGDRSAMQDMISGQVVFLYSDEPDPIKPLKVSQEKQAECGCEGLGSFRQESRSPRRWRQYLE